MTDNVVINKCASITRCLGRIREDYAMGRDSFLASYTLQDAITLNLQRACEQSIDLAAHISRIKNLGIPQSSKDEFVLLEKAGLLPPPLSRRLQGMVGYRNIAVHEYQNLKVEITLNIIEHHLEDFEVFIAIALALLP